MYCLNKNRSVFCDCITSMWTADGCNTVGVLCAEYGQPMVVIPWVVLQELDYIKNFKQVCQNRLVEYFFYHLVND